MRCLAAFAIVIFTTACRAEKPVATPSLPVVWSINQGLLAPESAYYDADSGFLFLSQVGGGGGAAKDGDGWISKLTIDGKVIENKWVTGFNAPKGLRSYQGTLWVSDIDRIVAVDIAAAKIREVIKVPRARFLNDLTCGPDGTVYVADMLASRIYRYRDKQLSVFAEGAAIESPNGLLVHEGQLIVAAWGAGMRDDFTTKAPGHLLSLDLRDGKRTLITAEIGRAHV